MEQVATLREEVKNGRIRSLVESFTYLESADGVICSGVALPLNQRSRNGVAYISESAEDTVKTMIGCPVLFNHNPDRVLGHVTNAYVEDNKVKYELNLDSTDPLYNKIKRGDISKVSIQVMYDEDKTYYDGTDDTSYAYISEFLELSFVSIPGFIDTTVMLHESYISKNKSKLASENKDLSKEQAHNSTTVDSGDTMTKTKTEEMSSDDVVKLIQEMADKMEETGKSIQTIVDRMDTLEKKMEEYDKDDETEEEATDSDDEEEDDKKSESVKRKSKIVSGTSETMTISSKDIKKAFMGM